VQRQEKKLKMKPLAVLTPLCLCLVAGSARADLEPYSFGASETVQHQSNLNHTDDAHRTADWISTTEFSAAVNQPLGRDKLVASAAVDFNRYKRTHPLNATGYQAAAEFDWSAIGDLSGALGADSHRRQYIAGDTADLTGANGATALNVRNLQTDNHAFARMALGGESRLTIFGGVDANQRRFSLSNDTFNSQEEQQWSTNLGTRYATSPDLSFGVSGAYVRGEYPHGTAPVTPSTTWTASNFSTKSLSATSKWQASGNSSLDASLGYTTENSDALSSNRHFVNGSLNWVWTPPSHFTVNLGFKRSSDADTSSTGSGVGIVNANNLNGTSVNNVGHLEVTYALTAKITLDASADYTQRKYSDVKQLDAADANGSTRTSRYFLTAHYQPTRTTDLSCGGGRESRRTDATLVNVTPAYTDNYVQCVAAIHFD
jgi:hypothetical protein